MNLTAICSNPWDLSCLIHCSSTILADCSKVIKTIIKVIRSPAYLLAGTGTSPGMSLEVGWKRFAASGCGSYTFCSRRDPMETYGRASLAAQEISAKHFLDVRAHSFILCVENSKM